MYCCFLPWWWHHYDTRVEISTVRVYIPTSPSSWSIMMMIDFFYAFTFTYLLYNNLHVKVPTLWMHNISLHMQTKEPDWADGQKLKTRLHTYRLHSLPMQSKTQAPHWAFRVALCTVSFVECQRAFASPLLPQLIDTLLFYLLSKKQRDHWCTVHEHIYVLMSAFLDVWLCILLITNIHRQAHKYPYRQNHSYSEMDSSCNRNADIVYPSPKLLK